MDIRFMSYEDYLVATNKGDNKESWLEWKIASSEGKCDIEFATQCANHYKFPLLNESNAEENVKIMEKLMGNVKIMEKLMGIEE